MPARPAPGLEVAAFSKPVLEGFIRAAAGVPSSGHWDAPTQVTYLCKYLADSAIDAKTIVVERGYFDRHFMDEHANYYSVCLSSPANYCVRLHFFSKPFDQKQLDSALVDGDPNSKQIEQLQESYLGFTCIRPVSDVPIGRTVLAPFPPDTGKPNTRRVIMAVQAHTVHLGGLELTVTGLPFQQQDQRVGACASVSAWTALSCVARADGDRPPTPASVTARAVQFQTHGSRPFPSMGLTVDEICQTIHAHGKTPEVLALMKEGRFARPILRAFIRSGIPVILVLSAAKREKPGAKLEHEPGDGHAVTCTGFEFNDSLLAAEPGIEYKLPGEKFNKIYVHDDATGPYAKADLFDEPVYVKDLSNGKLVKLGPGVSFTINGVPLILSQLVAPMYPKVRATVFDLFDVGAKWLDWVADNESLKPAQFSLDARLVKSGTYMRELREDKSGIHLASEKVEFQKSAGLSRYTGIVEIGLDEKPYLEFLWDTTDRLTYDPHGMKGLLGIVTKSAKARSGVTVSLAKGMGIPVV